MLPKPNEGFDWVQGASRPTLVCRALEPYAANLITTRQWPLGAATAEDRDGAWDDVASAMGVAAAGLARAQQVHGAAVVVRRRGNPPGVISPAASALPQADILVSNDPALAVAVQAADCVPILIADRRAGAVAAAHAGWRGLSSRVPRATVRALSAAFESRVSDLVAAVGPSISAEHYEVDAAVRNAFESAGFSDAQLRRWFLPGVRPAHWQFDGWAAAREQLADAGIADDQIFVAGLCTFTRADLLCSYRRDGKAAGRIAAAIRARPE